MLIRPIFNSLSLSLFVCVSLYVYSCLSELYFLLLFFSDEDRNAHLKISNGTSHFVCHSFRRGFSLQFFHFLLSSVCISPPSWLLSSVLFAYTRNISETTHSISFVSVFISHFNETNIQPTRASLNIFFDDKRSEKTNGKTRFT